MMAHDGFCETTVEDPITKVTQEKFGITYLYPWQRLVIGNIIDAAKAYAKKLVGSEASDVCDDEIYDEDGNLRGRQIILLPTGTGKSLCFQVPALFLDGPTLIIYPLLALMGDQFRRMQEANLDPALFRGGQSKEERQAQFDRLEGKDDRPPARLIIANPEVLARMQAPDESVRDAQDTADHSPPIFSEVFKRIAAQRVAHVAIDESHCVSEWGDTFRPAYLNLGAVIEELDPPAVTAFTATASEPVLRRISEVLFKGSAHLVRSGGDRPNIVYSVVKAYAKESALLMEICKRRRPLVVFCSTRGGTERTAALLRERLHDTDIRFYHAGLKKDEKIEVESWFHAHERAILVTTCAWGMGVDKKDVRTVIHLNPSSTAEAYIQEAGRGGRDGTVAEAVLLWSPEDTHTLERNIEHLGKGRAMVLKEFAETSSCRREVLLRALGDPYIGENAPGNEQTACSGCDNCDGTAAQEPLDGQAVLEWLKQNRQCRSKNAAAIELARIANEASNKKYGISAWHRKDMEALLESLIRAEKIKELKKFPWKDFITNP